MCCRRLRGIVSCRFLSGGVFPGVLFEDLDGKFKGGKFRWEIQDLDPNFVNNPPSFHAHFIPPLERSC